MDNAELERNLEKNIDLRLTELEKRIELQFDANSVALNLSSVMLEKRLESMNEFRTQIKEERVNLVSRAEYAIQHDRIMDDIKDLQLSKAILEGKASQSSVTLVTVLSVIGLLLSLISVLFHFL